MDICHLKSAQLDWNQNFKNTKVVFVLRGDIVRDDSGSYGVFTEQGSSASQLTAAKIMNIIARLLGGRNISLHLYGHPLAGLSWERQFEKVR